MKPVRIGVSSSSEHLSRLSRLFRDMQDSPCFLKSIGQAFLQVYYRSKTCAKGERDYYFPDREFDDNELIKIGKLVAKTIREDTLDEVEAKTISCLIAKPKDHFSPDFLSVTAGALQALILRGQSELFGAEIKAQYDERKDESSKKELATRLQLFICTSENSSTQFQKVFNLLMLLGYTDINTRGNHRLINSIFNDSDGLKKSREYMDGDALVMSGTTIKLRVIDDKIVGVNGVSSVLDLEELANAFREIDARSRSAPVGPGRGAGGSGST